MNRLAFVLGSITRRPLRSGVTAVGVAAAVAALFILLSFQRGYQAGIGAELDRLGAHVLVVPKGCPYDAASIALHGASWPCYLEQKYLQTVRATPHVAVAAPVFMSAVYGAGTGQQTVYCGVEDDILRVKRAWWIQGAFPSFPGDLLVGSALAARSGWRVGQQVTLPGLPDRRQGRICGILAPTQGADDEWMYIGLRDAQRWFARPGQLTHLLVRLDDPQALDEVVQSLRGCNAGLEMNVIPLAHLFRTIQNLVQDTRLLLGSVALVAFLAAGAGVSNTVLMAVAERTREIGVLRALGASRGSVFVLIWFETTVLCLAGGIGGVVAALAAGHGVENWVRAQLPFVPTEPLLQPAAMIFAICLLGSIALGTVTGLLPAWRASRLAPAEAIRKTRGA